MPYIPWNLCIILLYSADVNVKPKVTKPKTKNQVKKPVVTTERMYNDPPQPDPIVPASKFAFKRTRSEILF